jgi:hypothetical protein
MLKETLGMVVEDPVEATPPNAHSHKPNPHTSCAVTRAGLNDSGRPDLCDQPTNPTHLTSPTYPTYPTNLTSPTSPTNPTSPTDPTNPTSPTDPTDLTSPTFMARRQTCIRLPTR